jgi:hypothetical protein
MEVHPVLTVNGKAEAEAIVQDARSLKIMPRAEHGARQEFKTGELR